MEFLHTDNAPAAIGPYSQAVKLNGVLYTSGQIALKVNGEMIRNDIKEQTRQIFKINFFKIFSICNKYN